MMRTFTTIDRHFVTFFFQFTKEMFNVEAAKLIYYIACHPYSELQIMQANQSRIFSLSMLRWKIVILPGKNLSIVELYFELIDCKDSNGSR